MRRRHDILILMMQPAIPFHRNYVPTSPPLGLAHLSAALKNQGFSPRIIDGYATPLNRDQLTELVRNRGVGLALLSAYSENLSNTVRAARCIKATSPKTVVIVGGYHVSYLWEDVLAEPSVDGVVRGEGERAVVALAQSIAGGDRNLSRVPGIVCRHARNDPSPTPAPIAAMAAEEILLPERDGLRLDLYQQPGTIMSSRGCDGACVFCSSGVMGKECCRFAPSQAIIDDVVLLTTRYGIRHFRVWDDTFTVSPARAHAICDLLKKWCSGITWSCGTRVDRVDRVLLQNMYEAGCRRINMGVESGVEHIRRTLGKPFRNDEARQAIAIARDVGMKVNASFIVPAPEDTVDTVSATLEFATSLIRAVDCACSFNVAVPFPGSVLWDHADRFGIRILHRNWDRYNFREVVFETRHLSANAIRTLAVRAHLLQHRVNRRPRQAAETTSEKVPWICCHC